jgi:hypothetical protein
MTIEGTYKGMRASYGAIVFGRPVGTNLPLRNYVCFKITMQLNIPKPPLGSLTKEKRKIKHPDKVTGYTPEGKRAAGLYMNKDGQYAWIKGYVEGDFQLDAPHKIKVLHHTLSRLDT